MELNCLSISVGRAGELDSFVFGGELVCRELYFPELRCLAYSLGRRGEGRRHGNLT